VSRSPAAFRPPASACRVLLFPPGDRAFLTAGLPGAPRPDPDGVSPFRTARCDRGGCPRYPGDGGALPARCRARPSPAASQRPVPAPRTRIPPAGPLITRHQRGFTRFTRPARPSPVTTRMGPAVPGLSPVLRTPPSPAAHDRAGPGVSTRPELRGRHNRPPNPRVHSRNATSCRNGRNGRSPRRRRCINIRADYSRVRPQPGRPTTRSPADNSAPTRRCALAPRRDGGAGKAPRSGQSVHEPECAGADAEPVVAVAVAVSRPDSLRLQLS